MSGGAGGEGGAHGSPPDGSPPEGATPEGATPGDSPTGESPPERGPAWVPWPWPPEPPPETRTWSAAERAAWVAVLITVVPPVAAVVLSARQAACTGGLHECEWAPVAAVVLALVAVVLAVPTIALLLGFGRPRFRTPGRPLPASYPRLAWAQLGLEALGVPPALSPTGSSSGVDLVFVLLVVLAFVTPITVARAGRRSLASR